MSILGQALRSFAQGVLHLLCPNFCWCCGAQLPNDPAHFCPDCRKKLTTDPKPACPRCVSTIGPHAVVAAGCPHCRKEELKFTAALRLSIYEEPLRGVILRLKQPGGETLAEVTGELWVQAQEERFRELQPDVVVPVPLHWSKRWWRRFNQSEVLSRVVAHHLGLPLQPGWLRRIRPTKQQKGTRSSERHENVKDAFATPAGLKLQGQRILLIDDVMTTGHTANQAARPLLRAGAGSVVVAVLAHRDWV